MKNKRHPHICENPECGKQFFGRKNAKFCSVKCSSKCRSRKPDLVAQVKTQSESLRKRAKREREEMRQRLAQRDALYAAHAAPVKVEERGGVRIETRGQMCIGWRSCSRVSHL